MTDTLVAGPNADQAAYWSDTMGPIWVELQDLMDAQLRDLGLAGVATLAPVAGERLLDIGPGCGATTLELARRVGPQGFVTAADISEPMLAVAKARAAAAGLGWTEFLLADAQTHAFAPVDGAFSRFGSMFFADPVAAFANIRKAIRPGGRLALVVWRAAAENPWMSAPMTAVAPLLSVPPAPPNPLAPGPFAFADRERLRGILAEAGFARIAIEPHDQAIGWSDVETALRMALRIGPAAAAMRDNPDRRPAMMDAVRAVLAAHAGPDGVRMGSATWIVRAE